MAFSLHFALDRFVAQCPRISPEFDFLLKKGENVKEEEVVENVVQLFLHPNYTIPVVGCFRPLMHKILERVVVLLEKVHLDLRSNSDRSDDSMVEFDEGKFLREDEDLDSAVLLRLVDEYYSRGKGLNLHEIACLAFCRALDMLPVLLRHVLKYFKFAPPPFERIKLINCSSKGLATVGNELLNVVRTSYRFLVSEQVADREVFKTLWDWDCFLDFGAKTDQLDLRWCSLQILSIMNMRDKASYYIDSEEAFSCWLRWTEFCQDVSLERASWHIDFSGERRLDTSVAECSADASNVTGSPSVFTSEFHDILAPKSSINSWLGRTEKPFVLTAALKKSFEMVFLAVSQKRPVLLRGPAGSGKTALINKLAQYQQSQVWSIHMDEHFDGKTLLGSYVCTEQPGEFRWQPGSLTQAVSRGIWVIFEDIDKAPADVHSILLPLLEGSSSFLTGQEEIRVDEGFRLFSTMSSSKLEAAEGKNSLSGLWQRVSVTSPGDVDLVNIVKAWFPELDLGPQTGKLIETFKQMNQLSGFQYRSTPSLDSHGKFSSRDLLKWCRRIAGLGISSVGAKDLTMTARYSIYKEAVDVFAAYLTSAENRLVLMSEIARLWEVLVYAAQPVNKPVIQDSRGDLWIGRVQLDRINVAQCQKKKRFVEISSSKKRFVEISSSVHTLERIACSVKFKEPVLLVGETGAGKTTLVQNLATRVGQRLTVLNLSQQSDVADLLGGFQPNDVQSVLVPLLKEYKDLLMNLTRTTEEKNRDHFDSLASSVTKDWDRLFRGFQKGINLYRSKMESGKKRKRSLIDQWESFSLKQEIAHAQFRVSGGMIFSYVEGPLVTALKNGDWILLDEINLAPPEILQRLIGVLEEGSLCLSERGDTDYVSRHPNFRIFACMNPATDAGKRDLPLSVRGRFTEYYVDDMLSDEDLFLFIKPYLDDGVPVHDLDRKIVRFYKAAKKESEERLQDGANQKPQYSLRSLYRALEYTMKARKKGRFQNALYDGFCMFFLTLLDEASAKLMNQMIVSYLLEGKEPRKVPLEEFLSDREIPLAGNSSDPFLETKSVTEHLNILARAVFVGRYPVLLQGPTSSGKTSLVKYLAAKTGHKFVRINNHEHTDLQEYLGSYITNPEGKLVFQEGALVKAVRNGHWIVLDELNLAPSDVLEALNRLLDDNRELYVPELREVVRPHPNFALFATQNPPNVYGGRKMLSRAFRNRFVEIHVDEIPLDDLLDILEKKCDVPQSYAKLMVSVMQDLQGHRQSSKVFAGKEGYITPRDLFRWASRYKLLGNSKEDLARDGYFLLAERLREDTERRVVREIMEKKFKVKLPEDDEMYKLDAQGVGKITWTKSMRRLYFLIERCYQLREPVLLIGETGGGKTTVCQALSIMKGSKLHILNCHQYSETSDFIGGFFPVRERSAIISKYKEICNELNSKAPEFFISYDINHAPQTLDKLSAVLSGRQGQMLPTDIPLEELNSMYEKLHELHNKWQSIFVWQDGPLIEAMKKGDLFLVDEISLADDSVLERLNSVLEPERKLSLAEKGGPDLENIAAHEDFFLLATMNPGGDYGKKELSPALRNRFTEIWVPSVSDLYELRCIGLEKISSQKLEPLVDVMLDFLKLWYEKTGRMLTVRDFLSWVSFLNLPEDILESEHALLHGAFLVLLDGLNLGTHLSKADAAQLRKESLGFLLKKLEDSGRCLDYSTLSSLEYYGWSEPDTSAKTSSLVTERMQCDKKNMFGIHPFYIKKGNDKCEKKGFNFDAPTTRRNALRVLRAMQLAKPVLLEGSPGVGKTSLIVEIGKHSGHKVVRINLSEQTDIMDLLGSDLPVESDQGIQFAWSDGILLQALKLGSWVLLDELNLAPQSVLEGLNSILDHRAEVFIPELGQTFECPKSFRIFACQNPTHQGGGRKGLPKSFLNRFTKVYVDELSEGDYRSICKTKYDIPDPFLEKLIAFNKRLHEETMLHHEFAQDGSPWEFNLRDVFRSCKMIQGAHHEQSQADCFLDTVYVQRMRTPTDRLEVVKLYEQVFGRKPYSNFLLRLQIDPEYLVVGNTPLKRRNPFQASGYLNSQLKILPGSLSSLEAVSNCVRYNWLCIIVGPPSSGKTSLVRLLAQLTGNVLNEVNLSPATDTSELVGCFEQRDGKFKWTTGVLVKAIEKGEWIVLDNANLCNPTVLDRINSLVEDSGSITLNERGIVDGKPVVPRIHHEFRMFLTVNPSFGEVSRAMRNRGVEVYLMQPSQFPAESSDDELEEAKRFVVLSGVPYGRLVDMISKAHVYARKEGAKLGARITLLELAHWMQLFKQLITDGKQPIWSLQLSWEHTYSSPLGEETGKIAQVINSYLSGSEILRINKFEDSLLCLPGGWPTPLNMRDFVLNSRETCVRRNCMYLEYLGKSFTNGQSLGQLYRVLFPRASLDIVSSYSGQKVFSSDMANKMLFFAANWAIEQAVGKSDVELYCSWLIWFGSQVEPQCSFFKSYVDVLTEEFEHPIWDQIFRCRYNLISHHKVHRKDEVDLESLLIPVLSMDLASLSASKVELKSDTELLRNSIKSVGLLRLSYQQWRSERQHTLGKKAKLYEPLLEALQNMEKKVLESLAGSQSFDVLFQLYDSLLESHRQLWSGLTSSNSDSVVVSRRALVKIVERFRSFFPSEVEIFMEEIRYVDHAFSDSLTSHKLLLWKHGGHPCVPSTEDIYRKQDQLISCCKLVWPNKKKSWECVGGNAPIEVVLSFNSELRSLAMEGISMSAFIGKTDEDDLQKIQQLEEMHQVFVQRLESEKSALEARVESSWETTWLADSSTCCSFPLDLPCTESGFHSWQAEFPILDNSSFFQDTELLHKLSRISLSDVQEEEQYMELKKLMGSMEYAKNFALNYSSRTPMELVPHQNILWTVDSLLDIPAANAKIAGYVLEMWFSWHRLLWRQYDLPQGVLNGDYANGVQLPHRLFRLMKTETVEGILQGSSCIGDFHLQSLKLRAASCDLWRGCHNIGSVKDFLLSSARSLFQKIIYSHRKSFSAENYNKIKSAFSSFMNGNVTEDGIKDMVYVLASSNHVIFKSLLESLIKPVLEGLYMNSGAESLVKTIGCVWVRIGCLRYRLLTQGNDLDPAAKYSIKHSQLVEKITSLELDINVRKECESLAGRFQLIEADDDRANLLESLRSQLVGMRRQMVFRPDSGNFRKLKHELDEFRKSNIPCTRLLDNMPLEQIQNWQETATNFMDRLSSEYSAYVDVVEPVQVAIHEIKLGLSLVLSSVVSGKALEKLGQQNMDCVLDSVHSFMRFPRKCSSEIQWNVESVDLQILERMLITSELPSVQNLKFTFYKNILQRVAHSVSEARVLDNASFALLNKYFEEFAKSWTLMRDELRKKEDDSAQKFKFKPRAFRIENVIDLDISTLKGSVRDVEIFDEWMESHARDDEVKDTVAEDWSAIEESVLSDVVDIHNRLFGSVDLVKLPGVVDVPDEENVSSFTDSYSLGIQMVRSLEGTVFSDFDSKLALEHLLHIGIEHERQFASPRKSGHVYNFYKHPNAPIMAKLVEPLVNLKKRVQVLLNDYPALQKLLDAVEMVLALPLSTPLAKVLSGLEFVLNKVWALQESGTKVHLGEYLKPVLGFVSSLQKLEFESGLALLSEVQVQFEQNAARLWYPLYSVLQHNIDDTKDVLAEFIVWSNIGEFKRRLQLLVAFHGQICNGVRQGFTSPRLVKTMAVLYNTIGYYIQFLPKISEHIETSRRDIEADLKKLKKLSQWENTMDHVTIEKSRMLRKKLKPIVLKFTDLLRQPVDPFFAQEVPKHGAGLSTQSPSDLAKSFESSQKLLKLVCRQTKTNLKDKDRLSLFFDSLKKLEVTHFAKECDVPPKLSLNKVWLTVRNVCKTVFGCCDIWGGEQKSLNKRRLFTVLRKRLGNCGLSKHRLNSEENAGNKWLHQRSYDAGHLLSNGCVDSSAQSNPNSSSFGSLDSEWRDANSFYFKGIASMQLMKRTRPFHKDFTLDEVDSCCSFVEHLFEILQEQRAAAYDFADQLKNLRQCVWPLANLFSETVSGADGVEWSFTPNQDAVFNCMWQQKQLLGNLSTMICEVRLLLQKVENNHLNTCPSSMKAAMKQISGLVDNFIPRVQTLKDSLDLHLLSNNKVIADLGASLHPLGVTKQMEQLVEDIFEDVRNFENNLLKLSGQDNEGGAIKLRILGHFGDVFEKAAMLKKQYTLDLEVRNQSQSMIEDGIHIEEVFQDVLKEIYKSISDIKMLSPVFDENICEWKGIFESEMQILKLGDGLEKLLNRCKEDPRLCSRSHLKHLYSELNVILAFGDGLLHDFLSMHRMVSTVAYALGDIFSSLFSKGYGTPEDQEIESDTKQDATGTGMGEGTGANDVSEQIEDEDQLIGLSEKPDKKQDEASDAPSKDDKGIEMEQDFDADTFSVSEDEDDENADDDEGNGDEQLESAMGETGDSGEIAKEKPLDKNDDESPPDINEKDEPGQSIKDNGAIDKELRAKTDTAPASEAGEDVPEDFDTQQDEASPPDMEDADMDKTNSLSDIGALNPDEPNKWSDDDDNNADDMNGPEPKDSHENDDLQGDTDIEMGEDKTDEMDESVAEEEGPENFDDNSKTENQEDRLENDGEADSTHQNPEEETISKPGTDHPVEDADMPSFESSNSLEPNVATDSGSVGPGAELTDGGDRQQDLAPCSGLPDSMHSELSVAGTSSGGKLGNDSFAAPIPQETSNQKIKPNPLRSIGDALDSWKERVKVSVDLDENNSGGDDVNDEAEKEYGYTAGFEKGTAQALGPASADQVQKDTEMDLDHGMKDMEEDIATDMEVDNQTSEKNHSFGSIPNSRNALERFPEKMDLDVQPEDFTECAPDQGEDSKMSRSFASLSRSYLSEDKSECVELCLNDELGKSKRLEDIPDDARDEAAKLWRRYELSTTRLSQELSEQLRLIMEPTIASKLQGDYKTGKRINMKKVISYIASHYRKDKIWLRRTRPNKRDYQVVIAVDDSASMGQCENFAKEALVTVCRAMSQLEVGKLAVASFGKTGNIKLLHDFDQPFTGEAGIKMISSLTFKQQNGIVDNPMADLLKCLGNMLDSAAVNARHPSGHNPLQQLVLIIGDGNFNERGLKRYVRDILNKKCMVAYLVLDNPKPESGLKSILDMKEWTRNGWLNYMDSFPFPHYAVLKNVEALPRTLADLLRQWFELMQNSRD